MSPPPEDVEEEVEVMHEEKQPGTHSFYYTISHLL